MFMPNLLPDFIPKLIVGFSIYTQEARLHAYPYQEEPSITNNRRVPFMI